MKARMLKHASEGEAMRRCRAISKARGYPKDPDRRGAQCPPAPFGRTLLSVEPLKRDKRAEWYTPEVLELEGRQEMVDGTRETIRNAGAVDVDQADWGELVIAAARIR